MKPAIGFIGVGCMGGAMAAHLLDLGYRVHVRDLRPEVEAPLLAQGATVHPTAKAVAAASDLVIVVVVDAPQTRSVLFDAEGVVHGLRAHGCVMLSPTIAPQDVEQMAKRLAQHGFQTIDAPLSGGPQRARDGSMSMMVAASDTVFAHHEPVLRALSSRLFRVGARLGDGARTKLVNNLLAGINLVGAAEALALARTMGLDPNRTMDVIDQSSGQSWIGADRLRRALAGDRVPRAAMALLTKDTGLAVAAADEAGFRGPLGRLTSETFAQAAQALGPQVDDSTMLLFLEQIAARRDRT